MAIYVCMNHEDYIYNCAYTIQPVINIMKNTLSFTF